MTVASLIGRLTTVSRAAVAEQKPRLTRLSPAVVRPARTVPATDRTLEESVALRDWHQDHVDALNAAITALEAFARAA